MKKCFISLISSVSEDQVSRRVAVSDFIDKLRLEVSKISCVFSLLKRRSRFRQDKRKRRKEKMRNKMIFGVIAIFLMTTLMIPAHAWIYPNCTSDLLYERYGPRAGKLLIHMYATDTVEFAALKAGEIDIMDRPLSKTEYIDMITHYASTIKIVNYGAEFGFYILDMNVYNETKLGNPDYGDPMTDLNPVYPNPMADVWLRRAIDYLLDRPALVVLPSIGAGFGFPMYTTVTPANPKYLLDVYGDASIPWAWDYSPTQAAAMLDAHGFAVGTSGYREWNGSILKLKFYIRSDHPARRDIGNVLVGHMTDLHFYFVEGENLFHATSGTTYEKVMIEKNFHMYTGGWSVGVDPDSFDLWSWIYYWHPGQCYNYAGHHDPLFDEAATGVRLANTQDEAVAASMQAQWIQCLNVLSAPLYCVAGNKAYYKTNTGGNAGDVTEGGNWTGVVNINGYGIDNGWSFMDMHTAAVEQSNAMTIDYGFKVPELKMMNPIYASWLFDSNALGLMYDSLLARNASNLGQFMGVVAESWDVGLYNLSGVGECSRVRFTIRPDATWSDGVPLTTADIFFTYVEMKRILSARGLPNPWWWSNVQYILSFSILDPYNFEVLLNQKSYWVLGWVGGNYILPKHIWKPVCETGNPQTTNINPTNYNLLTGNGPWMITEYNAAGAYASFVANPNYHHYSPLKAEIKPSSDNKNKFDLTPAPGMVKLNLENLDLRYALTVSGTVTVQFSNAIPVTTVTLTAENLNAGAKKSYDIWTPIAYGAYNITVNLASTLAPPNSRSFTQKFTEMIYVTIKEDITGSTLYDDIGLSAYPYKDELPSPDIAVDMQDVNRVSRAFGSLPGSPNWDPVADITGDYVIDVKDLITPGWSGSAVDIAVIKVCNMKTDCVPLPTVCRDMTMQVYVTVRNQGGYAETFNVAAYVNSTKIGEQTVSLNPAESTILTFTWNTSGFVEYGNYTLSAQVPALPYETHVYDNTLEDGSVLVTHMGDVTGDGKCDIEDLARVSAAFGSLRVSDPNDPRYGQYWHPVTCSVCPHPPNTDITNDEKVDIEDLSRTSGNFGWHQP
jgi:ABC-type transport system substrate-binding protein